MHALILKETLINSIIWVIKYQKISSYNNSSIFWFFWVKIVQFLAKIAWFSRFGGSADFTEASAELFRPILTEASAEASVSVVH